MLHPEAGSRHTSIYQHINKYSDTIQYYIENQQHSGNCSSNFSRNASAMSKHAHNNYAMK